MTHDKISAAVSSRREGAEEMSAEDRELDRQWRACFGQPLPMLGSAEIVRSILARAAALPKRNVP